MTDATLLRAIAHNNWANKELLEFCARLGPEQQAWTTAGVYGSIQATLQHILSAESGYLFSLTGGERPPQGTLPDGVWPFDVLRGLQRSNAKRIEEVLMNEKDPERMITRPSGAIVPSTVIVTQFIHHGSDHRAHVGSILGANGVEGPNLDAWAFGRAIGVSTAPLKTS